MSFLLLVEQVAPETPSTNQVVLYPKSDGLMYSKNDTGTELAIAQGIATQADQETGTSESLSVTPGRQHFHPSAAKGWVKANINGTVDGSYNVTSVSDNGTGDITVNWATDFSDTNYAVVNALKVDLGGAAASTYVTTINDSSGFAAGTTRSQMVRVSDGTVAVDPTEWMFIAFGDFA